MAQKTLRVGGGSAIVWWIRVVVLVGAFLIIVGGGIALVRPEMLVSSHDQINGAVHIYAGYLASRNFAIGLLLLSMLILRARAALANLMLLTGLIQLIDGCIDGIEGRWVIVPGVIVFGVIFLFAAARLRGYPFWSIEAWSDK